MFSSRFNLRYAIKFEMGSSLIGSSCLLHCGYCRSLHQYELWSVSKLQRSFHAISLHCSILNSFLFSVGVDEKMYSINRYSYYFVKA